MFVHLLLYHIQWTLQRHEQRRKGGTEKSSYRTVMDVTTVTKYLILSFHIGAGKWFKHALKHKYGVFKHLPTKLVLYEHKLLGSAAPQVPNSILPHFQMGPSLVSWALFPLEANESYQRQMQEPVASLGAPRKDWGSCTGGAAVCHWKDGQGHGASERQTLIFTLSSQAPEGFLPQSISFCTATYFSTLQHWWF